MVELRVTNSSIVLNNNISILSTNIPDNIEVIHSEEVHDDKKMIIA